MTQRDGSDIGLSRSGQWKRDHPERARQYNARSNARRPDRDRGEKKEQCAECSEPITGRKTQSGLCWRCFVESGGMSRVAYAREARKREARR